MSHYLCKLLRSWIVCPIVGVLVYWLVIDGAMVVSHRANPAIRFLGLELIAVPIFGLVGGLAIPVGFNLSRAMAGAQAKSMSRRIPCATFAGLGVGLNGLVAGWILMLPILALWNSYDPTVPLFLDAAGRDRSNQWSNIGACGFGFAGFLAGCALQVFDRAIATNNG